MLPMLVTLVVSFLLEERPLLSLKIISLEIQRKKRVLDAHHTVETETILVEGKRVSLNRVDGLIAVSRAIGDGDFKDGDGAPETQAITCVPDVLEREVKAADQFVVLACDGLWDVMDNQEVVDFISHRLSPSSKVSKSSKSTTSTSSSTSTTLSDEVLNNIAEQLVNYAVTDKKSPDNVSAVIVALPKKTNSKK